MAKKPTTITANKLEILRFPSMEDIFEGNIIEPDIGRKELIDQVGWQKGDYDRIKWPNEIWTASRGISKTGPEKESGRNRRIRCLLSPSSGGLDRQRHLHAALSTASRD